jgi:hypothetical protein
MTAFAELDAQNQVEAATLKFYLCLREGYIGSPMLSALYRSGTSPNDSALPR